MFSGGHDAYGRYTVPHADADTADWAQVVDGWVREALTHRQSYGVPSYGGHGGRGHGPGAGGMVAGVAGGLAAGYLAGEVMEEAFEDDGGGEE
jgi:sporulation-control protein